MLSWLKNIFESDKCEVKGATDKTHKTCPECDGTGLEDVFADCERCKGFGIVERASENHELTEVSR